MARSGSQMKVCGSRPTAFMITRWAATPCSLLLHLALQRSCLSTPGPYAHTGVAQIVMHLLVVSCCICTWLAATSDLLLTCDQCIFVCMDILAAMGSCSQRADCSAVTWCAWACRCTVTCPARTMTQARRTAQASFAPSWVAKNPIPTLDICAPAGLRYPVSMLTPRASNAHLSALSAITQQHTLLQNGHKQICLSHTELASAVAPQACAHSALEHVQVPKWLHRDCVFN